MSDLVNSWWFLGWLIAVGVLFAVALRAPLQIRLSGIGPMLYASGIVVVFVAIAVLANIALSLHDMQFDLTREKVFTPSAPALAVVDRLKRPVKLTYFYQGQDQHGKRARDIVEVMGRRSPLLEVDTVDPDKQPARAQDLGVRFYNVALLEADGRRVLVRSTDENEIAIGIQRVLREQVVNVCFIEGHNEYPNENFEFHTHLEKFSGHNHGGADAALIHTTGHGIGRMRRSLEALGYDVRTITPASMVRIPPECAAVIDAGPRTTYLPIESASLETYLKHGGSALLMFDLGFVLEPGLERLMQTLGVRFQQAVIIDPRNHYGADPQMVAVTAYDPHPITHDVSFTFYAGARALELEQPAPGISTFPLIASSKESYTSPVAAVEQREVTPRQHGVEPASEPRSHVVAAAIDGRLAAPGSRPFRAVVIGDGDFASNSFYPYVANSDLALAMVRWLLHEERNAPVASRIPTPPVIVLTKRQMQAIFLVVEILLPLAVIAVGGMIWWRRR